MKILGILLFFGSCGSANQSISSTDTVKVKLNEKFTVNLVTSMGTGYSWGLQDSSYSGFISLDSVTVVNNTEKIDDGTDTQIFQFHTIKKGEVLLHFELRRPWEKEKMPEKERKITVFIE